MSATPDNSALKALHPDLRRRLQRLDSLERQAQQIRANRWRTPPAPGRDSDSWLTTYLDLITLLLVMLVVLLGLSRMPNARVADATVTASAAAPEAPAPARTPDAVPPIAAQGLAAGAGTETSTDLSAPATETPDAAHDPAAPDTPLATPDASPATGMTAGDDAATAETPVLVTDSLQTLVEPTAPRQTPSAPAASPSPMAWVEDGPWTGTRLRLPDPDTPTRWSLPGFTALAEDTPPLQRVAQAPPAPEAPLPSVDALGLGDLGEGIDVIVNAQSISFRISNEILFPSGQADLAIAGPAVLDRLAEAIARHPYPVSVEGHTDIIPIQNDRFPSNWELATARATSVVRYLSRHGVAADRMRAVGYAHTRPLTTNDTPEGRSTNRRVELIMEIPPAP